MRAARRILPSYITSLHLQPNTSSLEGSRPTATLDWRQGQRCGEDKKPKVHDKGCKGAKCQRVVEEMRRTSTW